MNTIKLAFRTALCAAMLCQPIFASAEKADRDKPIVLEADRITLDDINKVHTLEGNVQLVKGTIVIRTEKLVVNQESNGFQTVTAYGGKDGLARFRQKRDGKNEYLEGEAERIEYRDQTEKAEFFKRSRVKSGADEVSGQYISYDGRTETYSVDGKGSTRDGRVKAVIQPRD